MLGSTMVAPLGIGIALLFYFAAKGVIYTYALDPARLTRNLDRAEALTQRSQYDADRIIEWQDKRIKSLLVQLRQAVDMTADGPTNTLQLIPDTARGEVIGSRGNLDKNLCFPSRFPQNSAR